MLSSMPTPQMAINASTQELAELIDSNLGALRPQSPAWQVADSPISGRGIFAIRDIEQGEELFREHTLLVGPTAHRSSNLRTCTICYNLPNGCDTDAQALCPSGCGLPVCPSCRPTERHQLECKLFRKWKPKDTERIEPRALRILSVVRCFFLTEKQRQLLYAMQANADRYYMKEVQRAADCFEHFPHEQDMLDYFYRTICAFNTNAFESRSRVGGNEILVRALFPLAGLLNHHCTPNAAHHFEDGETIVVSATERIPKGTEITMTYAKLLWSTLARKLFLAMTKHFICQCPRCQDPTVALVLAYPILGSSSSNNMNTTAAMIAHMAPDRNTTPEQLAKLIDVHLGDLHEADPNWTLAASVVAGRGVFATRDIARGELIFRERALVVGPTARKGAQLNTCVCCHCLLPAQGFLCAHRCTLPVCGPCSDSETHREECQHFQRWQPIDAVPEGAEPSGAEQINPLSLRILTAVRVFHLGQQQRSLVDAMQANAERGYRQEIIKAAQCFRNFPTTDKPFMDQLFRIVGVLNTNAFEAPCRVDGHETLLRGLFPLTAIMNHECTPNASHYFDNGRMAVVRAARDIPKGGEITTTYTKILWSNLTRGIFLKMTKNFMCDCPRCNDNTENGTYLSALFCREQGCKGLVIPVQTKTMQPDWRCLSCENVFPHAKMARYQDFALNTINNRINSSSVQDMIHFINELCPRFCPSSNYVLIEAKLNVIWRMTRFNAEQYTDQEVAHKDRYREEILAILHKLGAGECTLKKLITEEIQ